MVKQVNKWVKVRSVKDLIIVDINLDFHHLTPRARWTEQMVRNVLEENDFKPGNCVKTSKVFNNQAVGEGSPFLSGTFEFVNNDYVAPRQPVKVKSKPRPKQQTKLAVNQKIKTKEQ